MKRIVVVGFATRLHGEEYYDSIYSVFKRHISKTSISVEYLGPVTSIEEAHIIGESSKGSLPVLIALTGGTSQFIREFVKSGEHQRVVLIGHGEHNSLPSAISARAWLDNNGVWNWIYHCEKPDSPECGVVIERVFRVVGAISKLLGSKILLISEGEGKSELIEDFEDRFEATVDVVSIDTIVSKLEEADLKLIEHFYSVFNNYEFTLPRDKLSSVAKFYAVVKTIVEKENYTGVAVDCFPYLVKYKVTPCLALAVLNAEGVITACEGDLASLALMIISKELTGYSGLITNASMFKGCKAYFAHCTVAVNMIRSGRVLTHFESGYPYALSGDLLSDIYTFTSMSRDYSLIISDIGIPIAKGLLYETMCRTQITLELGFNAEEIPIYAPANHHVIIPGDLREELRAIANLLGIDYIEYRELVTGRVK